MTAVEFHTGVADPLGFACRLLRKALRKDARVLVTADAARLGPLDERLWTFEVQEFVPHLRWPPARPSLAARTPIWLAEAPPDGAPPVLVNLGAALAEAPEAFERIIEIVGDDEDERRAARARWRAYEARGLPITHHKAA